MTAPKLPAEPTPRTDKAICDLPPEGLSALLEMCSFARQLERELTAALALLAESQNDLADEKREHLITVGVAQAAIARAEAAEKDAANLRLANGEARKTIDSLCEQIGKLDPQFNCAG